jgi:sugar lactone lactonase YvrE
MKKFMLILVLLLAPIAALLVSCGNSTPTSNSPTPTPTFTSTPIASVKTLATFSSAVSFDGICVDSSDNIYIADYNGGTSGSLDEITSAGVTSALVAIPYISNVAFDGTNWYTGTENSPDFVYYSGGVTTSPISTGSFTSGLALNSNATTLALSSSTGTITYYTLPSFTQVTALNTSISTGSIAFDKSGNLYADVLGTAVIKYAAGTNTSPTTIAGSATSGYVDGAATSTAEFKFISGLTVDKNGNVYVVDQGNKAVREISGGTVQTLAGPTNGVSVTPLVTYAPANAAPYGIAVDGSGNVFFSDNNLHTISEYIP